MRGAYRRAYFSHQGCPGQGGSSGVHASPSRSGRVFSAAGGVHAASPPPACFHPFRLPLLAPPLGGCTLPPPACLESAYSLVGGLASAALGAGHRTNVPPPPFPPSLPGFPGTRTARRASERASERVGAAERATNQLNFRWRSATWQSLVPMRRARLAVWAMVVSCVEWSCSGFACVMAAGWRSWMRAVRPGRTHTVSLPTQRQSEMTQFLLCLEQ